MKAKYVLVAILLMSACIARAATNDLTALLQKGLFEEEANHNLEAAMQAYQAAITEHDKDRRLVATAVFRLGECLRKQGKTNEAAAQYQRVLREFSEQEPLVKMSAANVGNRTLAQAGGDNPATAKSEPTPELRALQSVYQEIAPKAITSRAFASRVSKLSTSDLAAFFSTVRPDETLIRLLQAKDTALAKLTEKGQQLGPDHPDRKAAENEYEQRRRTVIARIDELQWAINNEAESLTLQETELKERIAKETAKSTQVVQKKVETIEQSTGVESDEDKEIRAISLMIKNSPDLINAGNGQGPRNTPLKKAASLGQLRVTEFLLANGADIEATAGNEGDTPLLVAASSGHKAMVELLLSKGANPNGGGDGKSAGTPLDQAVRNGFKGVAEVLLAKKANVNSKNSGQERPLHLAVQRGNLPIVEMLLAAGAEIDPKNQDGLTPLYIAVKCQKSDIAVLLISRTADVNVTDARHTTPLHWAVMAGSTDMAKLLQANGAKIEAASYDSQANGPTALTWAIAKENESMVKLLLENHANPNIRFDWNAFNWNHCTPLLMAIKRCGNEPGIVRSLLEHGADPNAKGDDSDAIPLLRAIQLRNNAALRHLIDYKVNLNVNSPWGSYLTAVGYGNSEAVEILSEAGADINVNENFYDTALHLAVQRNDTRMVSLLIAHKANVNALNGTGQPPLAYTRRDNAQPEEKARLAEIAEVLIKAGADVNYERKVQICVCGINSDKPTPVFYKGTNTHNYHTLAELIAESYASQNGRNGNGENCFGITRFPDFSDITISRLQPDGTTKPARVDATTLLESSDASKDVGLEWGDIVTIAELDHPVSSIWYQIPLDQFDRLNNLVSRKVDVIVKGQKSTVNLLSRLAETGSVPSLQAKGYGAFLSSFRRDHTNTVVVGFKLSELIGRSGLLRVSSDVTRIKVTRHNPDGSTSKIICNEGPNQTGYAYGLWLRDGDVVEIPEKDPNAPPVAGSSSEPGIQISPRPLPAPGPGAIPQIPRPLPAPSIAPPPSR